MCSHFYTLLASDTLHKLAGPAHKSKGTKGEGLWFEAQLLAERKHVYLAEEGWVNWALIAHWPEYVLLVTRSFEITHTHAH